MTETNVLFNPFRIIPCLQVVRGGRMVKTTRYRNPSYVGDLINGLRIFNEKEVDEIAVIDITATREARGPDFAMIEEMASECFMPLAYGGGVSTVAQIERIIQLGVEKVILNTAALEDGVELLRAASGSVGSQSVVVSIDVKKRWLGGYAVCTRSATRVLRDDLLQTIDAVAEAGAGEILLSAVDRDGTQQGYDHELIRRVASRTGLPVIASGGARDAMDMAMAVKKSGASAAAAGAFLVYRGPHRAVLLSYPSVEEIHACVDELEQR